MTTPRYAPALDTLPLIHQGKTRDTFATTSPETRLIVATQRLSTHNIIHLSEVPYKDQVLTALTIFWLRNILDKAQIKHHLVAYGQGIYSHLPGAKSEYPADLHLRAIVVKELSMIPVEFIYRKYLVGSLFKEFYSKNIANPYGIPLQAGFPLMTKFPRPIFTPTDKSEVDAPLNTEVTIALHPRASEISAQVFALVGDHLRRMKIELVDSKSEVGLDSTGEPVIADEIATPDSSRFCEQSEIKLGQEPPWLDKQIARDEAEKIWGKDKKCPLEFAPEIIRKLSETYLEIFFRITKVDLHEFQTMCLE